MRTTLKKTARVTNALVGLVGGLRILLQSLWTLSLKMNVILTRFGPDR